MAGPEKGKKLAKVSDGAKKKRKKSLDQVASGEFKVKGQKQESSTKGSKKGGHGSKERRSQGSSKPGHQQHDEVEGEDVEHDPLLLTILHPATLSEKNGSESGGRQHLKKVSLAQSEGSKKPSLAGTISQLSLDFNDDADEGDEEDAGEGPGSKPGTGNSSGERDEEFWDRMRPPTPPTTGVSAFGFDPATTKVQYYTTSTGDIVNEMISDPDVTLITESTRSSVSIPCDLEDCGVVPLDEDSDEEEDRTVRENFPGVFTQHEPWLTPAPGTKPGAVQWQEVVLGAEDAPAAPEDDEMGDFKFTHMDMSCRGLADLTLIHHFTSLRSITLTNNFIKSLRDFAGMVNLVKLNVSGNELKEFIDIPTRVLLPIQEINFSRNQVSKILNLSAFWALTLVDLSYNRLTVVDKFQECPYLRVLNLSHNFITEIRNLVCPNLIILMLKNNELDDINCLENCPNVRYLNVSYNKIQSLKNLRFMSRLMELRCTDNQIADLLELEVLKSLVNLSHLRIEPNPCSEIGMYRLMVIYMFPQISWLDGTPVIPEEILETTNTFNPSYKKLAFESHADALMEKATQSTSILFQSFCNLHPIPPMIFLVGSSKSDANRLAMFLKHKLKSDVLLGGVHSTATTIEGGNPNVDIPVSLESFKELKKRGELLSTSSILGRLCGFSMSQITKATERRALLVGTIPLQTAICLLQWNFKPKLILILPSGRPRFNVDEFIEAEAAKQKEQQENPEVVEEEPMHDHLIKFAKRAVVSKAHKLPVITQAQPIHSILKTRTTVQEDNMWDMANLPPSVVKMADDAAGVVKLASEAGLNDTSIEKKADDSKQYGSDAPDNAIVRQSSVMSTKAEETSTKIPEARVIVDSIMANTINIEGIAAGVEQRIESRHSSVSNLEEETASVVKEAPPFTVTNRLKRLQRLLTTLLAQNEDSEQYSPFLPEINLDIPKIEPEIGASIDWRATILRNHFYNDLLESDLPYFMVLGPLQGLDDVPVHPVMFQSSLVPRSSIDSELLKLQDLENFELFIRKVDSKMLETEETESEELLWNEEMELGGTGDVNEQIETSEITKIKSAVNTMKEENVLTDVIPSWQSVEVEESYHSVMGACCGDAEEEMEADSNANIPPTTEQTLRRSIYGELIKDEESDEDEDVEAAVNVPQDSRHRFKHRDALEKAILKTRDDYLEYHLENPGFFSAVLDTTNFEECCLAFFEFAQITLKEFQEDKNKQELTSSHAGKNAIDKDHFVSDKIRHCKAQAKEWAKGYHHPLQHMRNLKTDCVDSGILFEKQRCPVNLMDPSFPRPLGTAKVLQLKHVAARRQKMEAEMMRHREECKQESEEDESTNSSSSEDETLASTSLSSNPPEYSNSSEPFDAEFAEMEA